MLASSSMEQTRAKIFALILNFRERNIRNLSEQFQVKRKKERHDFNHSGKLRKSSKVRHDLESQNRAQFAGCKTQVVVTLVFAVLSLCYLTIAIVRYCNKELAAAEKRKSQIVDKIVNHAIMTRFDTSGDGVISFAKPRNPRHFEGIHGGRKCVADTLLTKTEFGALKGAQPRFHTYTFWRQNTFWDTFGPRL